MAFSQALTFIRNLFALIISLFMVTGCAGAPEAPAQAEKAENADIRVVQFNLRCTGTGATGVAYREPLMIAELEAIGADSMGFQEATPEWMEYLNAHLENYAGVGGGRNDGENSGEASPVFYRTDKYELLDSGMFWLSDTPYEAGSKYFYSAHIRICTWAELKNKEDGTVYYHFNTHLDNISSKARVNQLNVLFSEMDRIAGDAAVVLTGDFNDGEDSEMYNLVSSRMTDCKYSAPVTENKNTYHNYGLSSKMLDYIFVSDKMQPLVYHVIDDKVNGAYLSDHYGLYADIDID